MLIFKNIASSSGPDVSCSTSFDIAEACQSRCHIESDGGTEEMRLLDTNNGKYRLWKVGEQITLNLQSRKSHIACRNRSQKIITSMVRPILDERFVCFNHCQTAIICRLVFRLLCRILIGEAIPRKKFHAFKIQNTLIVLPWNLTLHCHIIGPMMWIKYFWIYILNVKYFFWKIMNS